MPTIERTLVKSPPELWELVDDPELMERWSAELFGGPRSDGVRVVERDPGERLVWESPGAGGDTRIELALAEKGWGTNVSVRVRRSGTRAAGGAGSVLECLLDDLGSPNRRPFTRS